MGNGIVENGNDNHIRRELEHDPVTRDDVEKRGIGLPAGQCVPSCFPDERAQRRFHTGGGERSDLRHGNRSGLVLRALAEQKNEQMTVGDVMTDQVVTGSPEMSVDEASSLMAQNQIRRLPVVENNQLVGMVSLGDMAVRQPHVNEAGQALSNISEPSSPQM